MALSILDGNQSATTLSTILSSGQHITAHTVVSLGAQAITDIVSATSAGLTNTQLRANAVTIAGTVTANIGGIASSVTLPVRLNAEKFGEAPSGQDTLVVCNSSGMLLVDANSGGSSVLGFDGNAFVQVKPVSGSSVTIGNSVTIGSLPAISGTVTANGGDGTFLVGGLRSGGKTALQLDTGTGYLQTKVESLPSLVAGTAQIGSVTASISGTVPISISSVTVGNSITISSLPAISGTVTANAGDTSFFVSGLDVYAHRSVLYSSSGIGFNNDDGRPVDIDNPLPISGTVTANLAQGIISESEDVGSLAPRLVAGVFDFNGTQFGDNKPFPISGTVTANSSNGSLTTRFGSVTTANTAFATSAVTNTNRKYLLIQNITTASNVITVGIGFTPTTTQGIQLFAGAGLTFEGSYIPTGAVNLLSSVTASCYIILEA